MILIVAAAVKDAAEEIAESDFEGEKPWLTPRERKEEERGFLKKYCSKKGEEKESFV